VGFIFVWRKQMYPSHSVIFQQLSLALESLLSWNEFDNTKCIRHNLKNYLTAKVRLYDTVDTYLGAFDQAVVDNGLADKLNIGKGDNLWEGDNGKLRDEIIEILAKYLLAIRNIVCN